MRRFDDREKPDLEYPVTWGYTIIGPDADALHALAAEILEGRDYTVRPSHESRSGKYVSLLVEVEVRDEADRLGIFDAFKGHAAVKFVL